MKEVQYRNMTVKELQSAYYTDQLDNIGKEYFIERLLEDVEKLKDTIFSIEVSMLNNKFTRLKINSDYEYEGYED